MSYLWRYRGPKRAASQQTTLISGRIETRRLYIFPQMKDYWNWPGLKLGLAVSCTSIDKRTGNHRENVQFAITNLPPDTPGQKLLKYFRDHWGVENRCHYVLDESMGEDRCRVTTNPGLVSGLRKIALAVLQSIKGKQTVKSTMRKLWKPGIMF